MLLDFLRVRNEAAASNRARCVLAALTMVLLSGAAESRDITVELDDSTRACGVQGSFIVPVSAGVAWVVLTDYDHIPGFVTSMVSSRAERRSDGSLRVHQIATGSPMAGVVRRRVHLELDTREEPPRRIAFTDVLGKDFSSYVGEWLIVPMPDTGAVYVTYRLTAEPHGAIARAFCRGALRKTTRELLEQVRAEMLRRRDDN